MVIVLLFAISPALADKSVSAGFKPSYEISPLVHRFEASQGADVPFEFTIRNLGRRTILKVEPVAMKQDESGQVGPREESGPAPDIRMSSPARMELERGSTQRVRGKIVVPRDGSSFQAYGILVTDLGPPEGSGREEKPDETELSVKFITRYMLRVEVVVRGVRNENAKKLELTDGTLTDSQGRAMAELRVSNPTGTPFEFEARARLIQANGKPLGPPFKLAMPVRLNSTDKGRFRSRLLGNSRVKTVAALPDPIMPGDYQMVVDLMVDGRPAVSQTFPVTVTEEQFPAQRLVVAQIVKDVRVSPTQVELSLKPKGNRIVPVKVTNTSDRPVTVRLTARTVSGTVAPDWAVIRPESLELAAGTSRSVVVSMRNAEGFTQHQYAGLRVEVTPEDGGVGGSRDLLVALVTRNDSAAKPEVGLLQRDVSTATAGFTIPVTNHGEAHFPLRAKLLLTDSYGRTIELEGGFDEWVLPGKSGLIRFPTDKPLPPGEYHLKAEVQTGEKQPLILRDKFVIASPLLTDAKP